METPCLESRLRAAVERRAFVTALRKTPCATLAEIRAFIEAGGEQGMWLGAVTIGELITPPPRTARGARPSLPIDRLRLNRAKRCTGADFDALVYEVLGEAGGCVGASTLRERVGGPRWKLQGSLRRLVEAGKVLRTGVTSDTRYLAIAGAL
jgi:hypothetical protein